MLTLLDSWFSGLSLPIRLVSCACVMLLIAILAYLTRQLKKSGAVAAFLMGYLTVILSGFSALSMYLFFLVSAAFLGAFSKKVKGVSDVVKKGGKRDAMQVWANGLMPLVGLVAYFFTDSRVFLIAFSAALAESTADTYASDIGVTSTETPVSIVTLSPMKRGMSGGVTVLGTLSGLLGAFLIALLFHSLFDGQIRETLFVTIVGTSGMLFDSVLGATVQAMFYDERKDAFTEKDKDDDGNGLKLVRGIRKFDNDAVNFSSNVLSFVFALALYGLLF